jgi:hypothetical protein
MSSSPILPPQNTGPADSTLQSGVPPRSSWKRFKSRLDKLLKRDGLAYAAGAVATLFASILILCTALVRLYAGLWDYWVHPTEADRLKYLMEPVELGFFAPLPFLIYIGVCMLIADMIPENGRKWYSSKIKESSEHNLEIIKSMVIALIVGVFATDLLHRALRDEGLSYQTSLSHCSVIFVLSIFIWVIKPRRSSPFAGHIGDTHPRQPDSGAVLSPDPASTSSISPKPTGDSDGA